MDSDIDRTSVTIDHALARALTELLSLRTALENDAKSTWCAMLAHNLQRFSADHALDGWSD
jgi:hypothetical protein